MAKPRQYYVEDADWSYQSQDILLPDFIAKLTAIYEALSEDEKPTASLKYEYRSDDYGTSELKVFHFHTQSQEEADEEARQRHEMDLAERRRREKETKERELREWTRLSKKYGTTTPRVAG